MKKLLLTLLLFVVTFTMKSFAQDDDAPEWKQINLISAIIKYDIKVKDTVVSSYSQYYEEWGQYSATERTIKGKRRSNNEPFSLIQIMITTPDSVFVVFPDYGVGFKDTTGSKAKIIEKFELEEGDFEKVQDKELIEAGFAKEGTEEIGGRLCQIWKITKNGATQKMWIWKGIEVKTYVESPQGNSTTEAVELQEEPTIPFSKFKATPGTKWMTQNELQAELGKYLN